MATGGQAVMHTSDKCVFYESSVKVEQASQFEAFCTGIDSQSDLDCFVATLAEDKPIYQEASHRILAYKYTNGDGDIKMDADDDGEVGASEKLLSFINQNDLSNVAVVVCRVYGGIHMYNRRFELIQECAVAALCKGNFLSQIPSLKSRLETVHQNTNSVPIKFARNGASRGVNNGVTNGTPKKGQNILLLCDSTGARIDAKKMIPGESVTKYSTPTLDAVTRKLKTVSNNYQTMVIASGINDLKTSSQHQIQRKLNEVLNTAKEYHPNKKIYVCSLLPDYGDPSPVNEVNSIMKTLAEKKGCGFVNSSSRFQGKQQWYRDAIHPNIRGSIEMAMEIRQTLGYSYVPRDSRTYNPPTPRTSRHEQVKTYSGALKNRQTEMNETERLKKNNMLSQNRSKPDIPYQHESPSQQREDMVQNGWCSRNSINNNSDNLAQYQSGKHNLNVSGLQQPWCNFMQYPHNVMQVNPQLPMYPQMQINGVPQWASSGFPRNSNSFSTGMMNNMIGLGNMRSYYPQ
jgi:hypothetical protein